MTQQPIPNMLMIQLLTVIEAGGTANLDRDELAIAIAVGIENGWLVDNKTVTPLGRSYCQKGMAVPEFIPNELNHPIFQAVKDELGTADARNKRERFEHKHRIPYRSARLLQKIIRDTEGTDT